MDNTRRLGRSGIEVSALGLGTAGIGGPHWDRSIYKDRPLGYGQVDDAESIRALRRALELGINFFDTADEYGCGHAERILGRALAGYRDEVIIATKFGYTFEEASREVTGADARPAYIRRACEASLRRLDTDYIDLYWLHLRDLPLEQAAEVRETLEALVAEGKIRWYGWSTDDVARARFFAEGKHCTAVMHRFNMILDAPEMLVLCEEADLASVNRIPLLMGILTGKHRDGLRLSEDDVRSVWFQGEHVQRDIDRVEALRSVLTRDGRSLAQAALAWIWTRSERTIPVPGFKRIEHVESNAAAIDYGLLDEDQMVAVERVMRGDES